jgi:hypothetical protein
MEKTQDIQRKRSKTTYFGGPGGVTLSRSLYIYFFFWPIHLHPMKMPFLVGPPGESFAAAVAQPLAPVAYAHRPQQTRRAAPRSRCGACGHSGGTGEGGGRGAISIQPAGRG